VQKSASTSPQPLELVVLCLPPPSHQMAPSPVQGSRAALACFLPACTGALHSRSCSESLRQKALNAQFRDLFLRFYCRPVSSAISRLAVAQHLTTSNCCCYSCTANLTAMLRLPTSLLTAATCLVALVSSHTVITYPGQRGNNLHTFGSVEDTNGLGETTLGTNDSNTYGQFPYGMQWMYPCTRAPRSSKLIACADVSKAEECGHQPTALYGL